MYEPADKLCLVGLNPLLDPSNRTYVATGDSGQGMTGAAIAAHGSHRRYPQPSQPLP